MPLFSEVSAVWDRGLVIGGAFALGLTLGCTPAPRVVGPSAVQSLSRDGDAQKSPRAAGSVGPASALSPSLPESKMSRLCGEEVGKADRLICERISQADSWLTAGRFDEAERELIALGDNQPLIEQALHLDVLTMSETRVPLALVVGRALLLLGPMSYGMGDHQTEAAEQLFQNLREIQSEPRYRERILLDLSRAKLFLGQAEEALELVEPLAQRVVDDAEVQATWGIALLAVGRVQDALGPLTKAQTLDPKEPERSLVLGTARLLLGDLEGAERSFRLALSLASQVGAGRGSSAELLARAYGDLAGVLLIQGDAAGGRAYLQRALGLMPRKATYLSNLAYAELLLGHPEQAKLEADRAILADPQLASARINLGLALTQLKDWQGARRSFNEALKLDPTDPRPTDNLKELELLINSAAPR